MMNKFITTLLAVLLITSLTGTTWAQVAEDAPRNVKLFVKAIQTKKDKKIDKAFRKINNDFEALEYLENNHPNYYQAYKLKKLSFRLKALKGESKEALENINTSLGSDFDLFIEEVDTTVTTFDQGFPAPVQSNNRKVLNYPNQNRTPNKVTFENANQNRISNQERARQYPNDERRSNQEIIRSRLGR
ncbi:MAG: hypothetical protein KC713_04430 [Candidatus Omnitrophica bacterium]|nr:hypothetical protein [Candidatus Omnitrophota bacterium]